MLPFRQIKIQEPKFTHPNKYHSDDSYHFLNNILEETKDKGFQEEAGYKRLVEIRDLSKSLMETKENIYKCLRRANLLGARNLLNEVPKRIKRLEELLKQDIPISDEQSAYCAFIFLEYIRMRSEGYMIDRKTGELSSSKFWGSDESWAKKNAGVDLVEGRVKFRKRYEAVRAEMDNFLKTSPIEEISDKLAEQDALSPIAPPLERLNIEINDILNRFNAEKGALKEEIDSLQKEASVLNVLSEQLKNEHLFDGCKTREEMQMKLLGLLEGGSEYKNLTETQQNKIKDKILGLHENESARTIFGRGAKNFMRDVVSHYHKKFQINVVEEQKINLSRLQEKKKQLEPLEKLINGLEEIKKELYSRSWFSWEKHNDLSALINRIKKNPDEKKYTNYLNSAEEILNKRRTPHVLRKRLGMSEKIKSMSLFDALFKESPAPKTEKQVPTQPSSERRTLK